METGKTDKLLARWLTPIFVGFDIFALFLQLVGAVMITGTQVTDTNAASKLQTGKDIALAGVTLQIIAFGLFSFIAVRFHFTSKRFKAELERRFVRVKGDKFVTFEGSPRRFKPNWRAMLYVVNASCILILVRGRAARRGWLCLELTMMCSRCGPSTARLTSPRARAATYNSSSGCRFSDPPGPSRRSLAGC